MSFTTAENRKIPTLTDYKNYFDEKTDVLLKPKGAQGISGYLFDVPNQESIEDRSEITEHVVENGEFINDHVIDLPKRVNLSGFVGELVARLPEGSDAAFETVSNRLTQVSGFLGVFTPGMIQKLNTVVQVADQVVQGVNTLIDRSKNLVNSFSEQEISPTRQEIAFNILSSLKKSRQLLAVTTPWSYYDDMMIESINAIQGADSSEISDFTVALKQVRFGEVEFTTFDENLFPPRADIQSDDPLEQGRTDGQEEDKGLLEGIVDGLGLDI